MDQIAGPANYTNPNTAGLIAAAAALMQAGGPSRTPISTGQALGQGMLSGLQARQQTGLGNLQAQQAETSNALQNLTLQGYRQMQAANQGAPTGPASISSSMGAQPSAPGNPDPGGYGQFARDSGLPSSGMLSGVSPGGVLNPQGAAGVTMPAPSPQATQAAAMPQQPTQARQPPPLFNQGSIYNQYRIAASTPGMQQVASQLLSLIEKGTPEGAYVGQDGGVYGRPGYDQFVGDKAGAIAAAEAPYKIAAGLAGQAGRVVSVDPTHEAHTGLDTMPPAFRQLIQSMMAGRGFGVPSSPQPAAQATPISPVLTGQSGNGTDSTGFPVRSDRTPSGAIRSQISPEGLAVAQKILPEQYDEARKNYQASQKLTGQLNEMEHNNELLNQANWSSTGPLAGTKIGAANWMNSLADSFGIPSSDKDGNPLRIDPAKTAAWQDYNKLSTRMGFELARTLGSREAMMIVQQAIGAVPSAQNTYLGAKLVSASLRAASQREQDFYEYLTDYAKKNGFNTMGADVAFNKAHPVKEYSDRAIIGAIPDDAKAALVNNPSLSNQFDEKYGRGTSKLLLGQ